MSKEQEVRRAFEKFAEDAEQAFPAVVTSVDENAHSCDVEPVNGPELFDVRLKGVIDDEEKGIIPIPAVDSTILVALIGDDVNTCYVARLSKIDKVIVVNESDYRIDFKSDGLEVEVGSSKVKVKEQEILFNDGNNKGLVKAEYLHQRLTEIETTLNQFIATYNAHTNSDPLTGTTGPPTAPATPLQPLSQLNLLKNDKVKH
jgi:hypothetical protein